MDKECRECRECRECTLVINPYRQVVQEDPDLCEFCQLVTMGLDETESQDERYEQ